MMRKKFSTRVEDYVEAIYFITKEKGRVRTSDIATFLGHRPPSVTEMLGKLQRKGLVRHRKYGDISLTAAGIRVAEEVSTRHKTLIDFLRLLGVDWRTAEIDACRIEHVVTRRTMNRLRKFVEFVQKNPAGLKWIERYKHFVRTGRHENSGEAT